MRILERVAVYEKGKIPHPHLGTATLTPIGMRSEPYGTHSVQHSVEMVFDRRLLPGETPEDALAEVAALSTLPSPWQVKVQGGASMYPNELPENSLLIREIDAAHMRSGIDPPHYYYSPASQDSGFLTRMGCEAALWGPGAVAQYHRRTEHVRIAEVAAAARAYHALARSFLGTE